MSLRLLKKSKGFTLIELLVVISIISLLSSIVLSSLSSARGRARDASRLSTIHEIQNALLTYYHDHGEYPGCPIANGMSTSCTTVGIDGYGALKEMVNINGDTLVPKYIPAISDDPLNTGGYGYYYALGRKKIDDHTYANVLDSDGTLDARYYIFVTRLEGREGNIDYSDIVDDTGNPAFGVSGLNYLVSGE